MHAAHQAAFQATSHKKGSKSANMNDLSRPERRRAGRRALPPTGEAQQRKRGSAPERRAGLEKHCTL